MLKFSAHYFHFSSPFFYVQCHIRNDGDEPDYMAVNPTDWLSSTVEACCKKFFAGYLFDACMGRYPPDSDDCNVMLYYPDWEGANKGCINDGQEPYYMLSNGKYFFSNSIEDCCKKFYEWDFYGCTGTMPDLTNGEYYPDWLGSSSSTCQKDNFGWHPDNCRMPKVWDHMWTAVSADCLTEKVGNNNNKHTTIMTFATGQ